MLANGGNSSSRSWRALAAVIALACCPGFATAAPKAVKPAPKPAAAKPAAAKPAAAKPAAAKPATSAKPAAAPAAPIQRVDADPPIVSCLPPESVQPGKVRIGFSIRDESSLFGVVLHWRLQGETAYRDVELPSSGPGFVAELDDVTGPFEFWIEAYDEFGNGPASFAGKDSPARVQVASAEPELASTGFERIDAYAPRGPRESAEAAVETVEGLVAVRQPFRAQRLGQVMTARRLQRRAVEVRLDGAVEYGSDIVYPGASLLGQSGSVSIAFQPLDSLTTFVDVSSGRTALSYPSGQGGLVGLRGTDLGLGVRWTSPLVGVSRAALVGALELPSIVSGSERAVGGRLGALWSIELPYVRLHANVVYRLDNSARTYAGRWTAFNTTAVGASRFDTFQSALAVEGNFSSRIFPYAEWRLVVPVDRLQFATCEGASETKTCGPNPPLLPAVFGQLPHFASVGLRVDVSPHVAIDAGADYALTTAGRGFSSNATRTVIPLDGLPIPPTLTARLGLSFQFGVTPAAEDGGGEVPSNGGAATGAAPQPP